MPSSLGEGPTLSLGEITTSDKESKMQRLPVLPDCSTMYFFQLYDITGADLNHISFYSTPKDDKYRKNNISHVTVPQSLVKNLPIRGRALWVTGSTPCPIWTASGPTPRHLPWPNIDQIVTFCQDEPCEIPIKPVYIRKRVCCIVNIFCDSYKQNIRLSTQLRDTGLKRTILIILL